MTALHEAGVALSFNRHAARFKRQVDADDVRLRAVIDALGPLVGRTILDLGCGKGRFAARLTEAGAFIVGLDVSPEMLAEGSGARTLGSARRLPFADASFDGVFAIEVLQHVHPSHLDEVLSEARRVLAPGGRLAIVDKNAAALDANRPWLPALAVKWIDVRRGRWMYPARGPLRERWFLASRMMALLSRRQFKGVEATPILSPREAGRAIFRILPHARSLILWTAHAPGGLND
ncbi:class I SAM-dependent methyltransferase [Isosphaeraceae bacterium EP7]